MLAAPARKLVALALLAVAAGCTPTPPAPSASPAEPRAADPSAPAPQRESSATSSAKTVVVLINEDPPSIWDVATQVGGAGGRQLLPVVHQFLVVTGSDGTPHPRLLAERPSVEGGTWRLLPDGRMETVWRLRTDARWHDGAPFTPDDVRFSWQVNRDPDLPNANRNVADLIQDVSVQANDTVVATWSSVYPFADRLGDRELILVPRHLLEDAYRGAKEAFLVQPYWSTEYVGLGPYRISRWERGSFLELAAFDQYFLGRPRIDTIRVQFVPDPNTMAANLLAESANTVLPPGGPDAELALRVKQEWEAHSYGTVLMYPLRWTFLEAQKQRNPEPADLADRRVRQALTHALERAELTRAVLGEYGVMADSWVQPGTPKYQALSPAVTRYPHDLRRAATLLDEAGWQLDQDGTRQKAGQRFHVSVRGNEDVVAIVADQWKTLGVTTRYESVPPQLARDREARASFRGFDVNTGPTALLNVVAKFSTDYIPTSENQWTGLNRGSYSNPAWDELGKSIFVTIDESKRLDMERELVRTYTGDLPSLPLYYGLEAVPVGGGLTGVQPILDTPHTGTILHTWNVHEWDLQPKS